MIAGNAIVNKAAGWIGQHESPMGTNRGPFVFKCQEATFLNGTGWPWCAAFICRVAKECGVPLAYNGAGAHDIADHHVSVSLATAHAGDVVDFNIGSGHTGILVSKGPPGFVTTIDGNWGDSVQRVQHPINVIRKVWRIPGVNGHPIVHRRHRKPLWVIATSASGHRKVILRAHHRSRVIRWLLHHRLLKHGITISRRKQR